jgi:hypothetical protein
MPKKKTRIVLSCSERGVLLTPLMLAPLAFSFIPDLHLVFFLSRMHMDWLFPPFIMSMAIVFLIWGCAYTAFVRRCPLHIAAWDVSVKIFSAFSLVSCRRCFTVAS